MERPPDDVRERASGAGLPRSQHIGRSHRARQSSKSPDKNTELILYCWGGFRSARSADNLQKMGYTNVASMSGGWRAWQAAGAPSKKVVDAPRASLQST